MKVKAKEIKQIINEAHYNLTYKRGRREYAPNVHELQEEVDKIVQKREQL